MGVKNINGVDVVDEAEVDTKIYTAVGLTVSLFDLYPAEGDFSLNVDNINDGVGAVAAEADTTDQYAEVDFVILAAIRQFRHYGHNTNGGDGRWKIQYWDGAAWQDWETEIPTRTTNDFSGWSSPAAGIKLTHKMRLICTTVDTSPDPDTSIIGELEIKY